MTRRNHAIRGVLLASTMTVVSFAFAADVAANPLELVPLRQAAFPEEEAGLLERGLVRELVDGVLKVRQASNCYSFSEPNDPSGLTCSTGKVRSPAA